MNDTQKEVTGSVPAFQYWRAAVAELAAWRRGRMRRSRATVEHEYRAWTVSLDTKVMAVAPDGRLLRTTVRAVREKNWNAIVDAIRRDLGATVGDRVLEVGAGDGTNLRELASRAPEFSWHGLDLVPRHSEVLPGDATAMRFEDDAFAVIVTYNALEQMPGAVVEKAWSEFARVARLGVVCVEPDFARAGVLQKLSMIRKDYVREIVEPAVARGLCLLRREWTIGGNPFNRPSLFVFRNGNMS